MGISMRSHAGYRERASPRTGDVITATGGVHFRGHDFRFRPCTKKWSQAKAGGAAHAVETAQRTLVTQGMSEADGRGPAPAETSSSHEKVRGT